jgi:hypothetical protein
MTDQRRRQRCYDELHFDFTPPWLFPHVGQSKEIEVPTSSQPIKVIFSACEAGRRRYTDRITAKSLLLPGNAKLSVRSNPT